MNIAVLAAVTTDSGSTGEEITFWICATLVIVGALGLVFSRKTVHGALFVALTMINLAVLYVVNGAPFLGLVQVIVYTGAVMMMFLFVVMLVGVDASDSLIETIKGQRTAAVLLVLGVGMILVIGIGVAMNDATSVGIDAANEEYGGNVEGLANLMFTKFLLPLEVVAALLITAAVGALVFTQRQGLEPKLDQPERARRRVEGFAAGVHPGPLPNPGVLASSNAVGSPALLPDGTPSQLSVPEPIRVNSGPDVVARAEAIESDRVEIEKLSSSHQALRSAGSSDESGQETRDDPHPEASDRTNTEGQNREEVGTGEIGLPVVPDDGESDSETNRDRGDI
jgi:NADH-quinone oxidoreductase subunit J